MKKKILHIITSLSGGGAQRVLFRIVESSVKNKSFFDHEILNLSGSGFYEDKFKQMNIKVHNIGIPRGSFAFKHITHIIKILKNSDCDLIQTWMYHSDFLGGILAKIFTNKKILWNIRSSNLSWNLNRWHTVIIAKICSVFSYFIPSVIISNSNRAIAYHRNYGYSKKKFNLIFNGFDSQILKKNSNLREKLRSEFKIKKDDFIIGNIARWDPQKDQNNLLKAFSLIPNKKKIKLFLLGENISKQNVHLMNLIKNYDIKKDEIILHEQTDRVYDILNIFDLSVISSVGESFPNAIPESMLMEIPVISTRVGDIENVINNSTGWICEPEKSYELKNKIVFAMEEFESKKTKWLQRKNNCREKIINFFEIDEMIKNYDSIWNETINNEKFSNIKRFKNFKYKNDKPIICHIISSMSHGGAQQVLARIIRADKKNKPQPIT